jgi:uncharacterized protein YsxB (DUF464 family)
LGCFVAGAAFAETAPAANDAPSPAAWVCAAVVALLIGTLTVVERRKSAAETADANARFAGMDVGQIVALEAELLACLYRHLTGVTVKVLAGEITETPRLKTGDYISNGPGGIVNNRSVNLHSPNIAGSRDPEMTAALTRLEETVRQSGNAGAIEQMDEFLVETRSAEPRPVVLRTLFTAIQQAVPAVAGMVDIAVKVRELWS